MVEAEGLHLFLCLCQGGECVLLKGVECVLFNGGDCVLLKGGECVLFNGGDCVLGGEVCLAGLFCSLVDNVLNMQFEAMELLIRVVFGTICIAISL